MTHEEILREIALLPPEGQRQVADFVAFLHQRYGCLSQVKEARSSDLAQDGFISMWQDREDMQDSSAWVSQSREREWI